MEKQSKSAENQRVSHGRELRDRPWPPIPFPRRDGPRQKPRRAAESLRVCWSPPAPPYGLPCGQATRLRRVLGYRLNNRAKLAWTEKARNRFKERVREITSRNRGHRVRDVIDELNLYIRGWLNYYKHSSTSSEVKDLAEWVRRRVRLYYWKQWKQPCTRRRHLLALGINPGRVHLVTRSRKGYWRMSQNKLVRAALNNRWLEEQGVPDMKAIWIVLYYGPNARV